MNVKIVFDKTTNTFSIEEKGDTFDITVGDTQNFTDEAIINLTVIPNDEEHMVELPE
jgi:hypothetical protein